jgi:CMP-N-acetylneuraminic acid synthetase
MAPLRVLALIPARGGSKGIPRKNIVPLGGRPLIAWTIAAARAARLVARVVVSTDDEEIAAVARDCGAEVPFRRPGAFADDAAPAVPVIAHALDALEHDGACFDAVAYLQPTSPFRTAQDIDAAVDIMAATGADTVVSVVAVPHHMAPSALMARREDGRIDFVAAPAERQFRRQDKERLLARNGPAILLTRCAVVRAGELYGPHIRPLDMHAFRSLDIDGPDDLLLAEAMRGLAATAG